jgi:hypothetical protein
MQEAAYSVFSFTLTQKTPPQSVDLDAIKKQIEPTTAVGRLYDALYFDDAAFVAREAK